jgi:hypothetical protein
MGVSAQVPKNGGELVSKAFTPPTGVFFWARAQTRKAKSWVPTEEKLSTRHL